MEEIKKILQQSASSENESDSEKSLKGLGLLKGKERAKCKKNGTLRLPTRRPDPNVYNRNAILARENRRRKKAYLEAVEKELEETRSTNRTLLRALEKQLKITQDLEKENHYFKDMLINYKNNRLMSPARKESEQLSRPISPVCIINSNCESWPSVSSSSLQNSEDDGSVVKDQQNQCEQPSWSNFFNEFTDFKPTKYDTPWNEVLEDDLLEMLEETNSSSTEVDVESHFVCDDHSYFKDATSSNEDSRLCLHIESDVEGSWLPPKQLLDDDYCSKMQCYHIECL